MEEGRQELFVRTVFEAARLVAVHIWNSSGKTLKRQQFDPKKLIPFSWDKQDALKTKQSTQQMLATMLSIASQQNAHVRQVEKRKRKRRVQ